MHEHMFVHPVNVRAAALDLIHRGLNDCEVARRTGLPRSTVRDWRRPRYVRKLSGNRCPRCWRVARGRIDFSEVDYAELLGLYLGDGHITRGPRTHRLRLSLDARYPTIVEQAVSLLERCFPQNSVGRHLEDGGSCAIVWIYSSHLTCLFPQHGPGKKHHRPIVLEPWQERIIEAEPWGFLRGCIRSDGCIFINPTGAYRYLSYEFANSSPDIREIFLSTCELVGVTCRTYRNKIRICRRESVQLLAANVGIKE
jgi:hypothetical protein